MREFLVSLASKASVPARPAAEGTSAAERHPAEHDLIEQDFLVEEVSIDGMCGVY